MVERFAAIGITYKSMLAGHSVGAWWHQQEPVISGDNPVIAMEPHVDHWHIQDMFVIRANGPELISDNLRPTKSLRVAEAGAVRGQELMRSAALTERMGWRGFRLLRRSCLWTFDQAR